MTGKELVLRAMAGESVERIPWVGFCGVHSASLIGTDAASFLRSAELIFQGQSRAIELYRLDGIPVLFDLQIEAEILGCALQWSGANPPAVVSHPVEEGQLSLEDLHVPQADEGRLPIALEATRRLREAYPEVALYGLITGPFTLALHLLGTSIFINMFDDPEQVKRVLQFCAEVGKAVAGYYAEAGCDVIAMVDPMTSQIGPEQFREFCTEYSRQVFDHIHACGAKGSFFVCGHAQQNIEAMCACHCDNISIDENIPLDYVRDVCRRHGISFGGNLQLTVVMLNGSEDDNRRNAIECMEIGGHEGFILAPGCDMPYATPAENVQAIAEVVHDEYAREVARELARAGSEAELTFDMSEYGSGNRVIVDIITLDSEGCAPCQYMVEAVKRVVPEFEGIVVWREHKIKYRESVTFMSSLMVHNIPTICIDGRISFVSQIPRKEALIAAIQKRINEKLKVRIGSQNRIIRVLGPATEDCLELRERVRQALTELGSSVRYEQIEDEEQIRACGVSETPAVTVTRQVTKSEGQVPSLVVIKEWLKQLEE